jgi:hypothetical protein
MILTNLTRAIQLMYTSQKCIYYNNTFWTYELVRRLSKDLQCSYLYPIRRC